MKKGEGRPKALPRAFWASFELRTWIEMGLGVLVLLTLVLFSQAFLGPQIAYAGDRVALMSLRESWAAVAAGFGLKGGPDSREEFLTEYRVFRSRPSVKRMLQGDPRFSSLAARANAAFTHLETAEQRGESSAVQAAAEFDAALFLMAARIGDYAQSQAETYRSFFAAIGVGVLAAITGFAVLELRLRASSAGEARNRALSRALIAAQEGERLRLSRELHDAVAQDLAAAKLYCGLVEGTDSRKAAKLLERAIEEIRSICHGLRPAELDKLGVSGATSRLCSDMARETGIEVNLRIEGLAGLGLEPEIEINLYRILQEALANVRRHAQARRVDVALLGSGTRVELSVDDDGRGPRGTEPGLGRTGMEERARMIGGSFRFGFGAGGGTSLRVAVPIGRDEPRSGAKGLVPMLLRRRKEDA